MNKLPHYSAVENWLEHSDFVQKPSFHISIRNISLDYGYCL